MSRLPTLLAGLQLAAVSAAGGAEDGLKDLYFGEALYYAHQGEYFAALERLDTELAQHYGLDEPALDALHYHIGDAEFSVGDFELSYRMHHRAGRAIRAVLEGDVEESVRNEAAYRLARIHFQKGQLADALHALERIDGRLPDGIESDVEFLRANIYMATERSPDAVEVLRRLQGAEGLAGFADYNLGIALLQSDRQGEALQQLDRAGGIRAADEAALSIRDKSNLVLGTLLMESEEFDEARQALDRVRLEGPLSNRALLSSGWAAASAQDYDRAIVPWSILAERASTDAAVQEARLALPFAYSQLNVHGRAALLYGEALQSFDEEVERLAASIDSIRKGRFLEALIREEIRQDKDWVIRLRTLPETPETYYLMELLASHDFQTALQNYLDLEDLRVKLESWQSSFDAFEDMIGLRRAYYEPLLPDIDGQFRELDSRIRLRRQQHELLDDRLQDLLVAPRPEFLATTEERMLSEQIARIEGALRGAEGARAAELRERARRLRGVLTFTLRTEYHERLTVFDEHLRSLQQAIDLMTERYESFVRVRQAAVHSFEGYEVPIRRLRTRVRDSLATVGLLMARQGHALEVVAINELNARRERLDNYRDQARYALADSYDRATKARAEAERAAADAPEGAPGPQASAVDPQGERP
ncbi:MAG: tetratricopeptide repeat protein [Gammaproteobacteria bacterium]|nr:tetratricopeptide repeat protein [Gammaproteobacteria bacterium]